LIKASHIVLAERKHHEQIRTSGNTRPFSVAPTVHHRNKAVCASTKDPAFFHCHPRNSIPIINFESIPQNLPAGLALEMTL